MSNARYDQNKQAQRDGESRPYQYCDSECSRIARRLSGRVLFYRFIPWQLVKHRRTVVMISAIVVLQATTRDAWESAVFESLEPCLERR